MPIYFLIFPFMWPRAFIYLFFFSITFPRGPSVFWRFSAIGYIRIRVVFSYAHAYLRAVYNISIVFFFSLFLYFRPKSFFCIPTTFLFFFSSSYYYDYFSFFFFSPAVQKKTINGSFDRGNSEKVIRVMRCNLILSFRISSDPSS